MDPIEKRIEAGTEVLVARAGAERIEAAMGTVTSHEGDSLCILLQQRLELVKPGVLMIVRPTAEDVTAWATSESLKSTPEGIALMLKVVRWEDAEEPRENRAKTSYDVDLNYRTQFPDGERKRTIGSTVDISKTGMRIRTRNPVPCNSVVHAHIRLDCDRNIELIGKVVRAVAGTEASRGAFEVGIVFIRFLSGYDELAELIRVFEAESVGEGGAEAEVAISGAAEQLGSDNTQTATDELAQDEVPDRTDEAA